MQYQPVEVRLIITSTRTHLDTESKKPCTYEYFTSSAENFLKIFIAQKIEWLVSLRVDVVSSSSSV